MAEYSKKTLEKVAKLRPIDDTLFRLMAARTDVCQEIIQTLLGDNTIKVVKVTPQITMVSLHREITVDALCELPDGSFINIEVQKGDRNDDIRRVRYHASIVTVNNTPKGKQFKDVPDVRVIYITEYDALHNNQTITKLGRCMKVGNQYIPVDDGEEILFANTVVNDGTDKSELLQLFLSDRAVTNKKFPAFCEALNHYKNTKKGRDEMCEIIEEYAREYAREYEIKNAKRLIISVNNFMQEFGKTLETACELSGASVEEYQNAKELIESIQKELTTV